MGLVGWGNPVLEMSAAVGRELLEKYGVQPGSVTLAEERHGTLFREFESDFPVEYFAGGAAQSACRVAAFMLTSTPKALRPLVSFVGVIGDDNHGRRLADCLSAAGVCGHYRIEVGAWTGVSAALVTLGGERTLVTRLGTAQCDRHIDLETAAAVKLVREASVIYVTGFLLATGAADSFACLGERCAAASAAGRPAHLCLNLASAFICRRFSSAFGAALPHVDVLVGDEAETVALGAALGLGGSLCDIALRLAAQPKQSGAGGRIVIVTRGAGATLAVVNGTVMDYEVAPLAEQAVVDPTGAGDAFAGGFLSQYLLGRPVPDCIHAGHWAARLIIQRPGCSLPDTCDYA